MGRRDSQLFEVGIGRQTWPHPSHCPGHRAKVSVRANPPARHLVPRSGFPGHTLSLSLTVTYSLLYHPVPSRHLTRSVILGHLQMH